ncbi:MAG: hypothetical protein ACP5E3_02465 [Bacteroidales bacterium]
MRYLINFLMLFAVSVLFIKCQAKIDADKQDVDDNGNSILVDSYGGMLNVKGIPGEYFTIQEINGRHCFVTPEGNGFLSIAITHLGAVQGVQPNNIFETRYNSDWNLYSDETERNLRKWGFNTIGYHANREMQKRMPYFLECYPMLSSQWRPDNIFSYEDVFDPEYHKKVEKAIDEMVKKAGSDKNAIGYYWNDIPMWNLDRTNKKRGTDWLSYYRELPASAEGKIIYVEYLKEKYNDDLTILNTIYRISAQSWEDVRGSNFSLTDRTTPTVKSDDQGFLRLIAREYYRLLGTITKEKDPNRLILGERFLVGDHPDLVLEEQNKWVDAIAFQPGGSFNEKEFAQMYSVVNKPIMICDHQESFYTDEYPRSMWSQLPSEEAAAQAYQDYLNQALSKSYILGYSRCQYISREVGNVLKQGLLDIYGEPYEKLVETVAKTNKSIMQRFAEGSLAEE